MIKSTVMHKVISVVLISIFIIFNNKAMAQENQLFPKTIKVTAQTELKVDPDEVIYSVNINEVGATFQAAYQQLEERVAEAKKILIAEDINPKAITISTYNINKNYQWNDGKRIDKGFVGSTRIEVKSKLDIKRIHSVLTRFGKDSPKLDLNVSFSISDLLMEESKDIMLIDAIRRAKKKATTIANALDKNIDDIQTVEFSEGHVPVYQNNYASSRNMKSASMESAAIETIKQMELKLSVHTIWLLES